MDGFAHLTKDKYQTANDDRPLLGITILLVEDSRYFSDAVRLMSIKSGARLRRADCLASANRHLRLYRPDLVLLDIGLPDGAGDLFLSELARLALRPPVIAMSGDPSKRATSLKAGADLFIEKPFYDLAFFQQAVLSQMPALDAHGGFQPRLVGDEVAPDPASLAEDLRQIRGILSESIAAGDGNRIRYSTQFLQSVAHAAADDDLAFLALQLADALASDQAWGPVARSIISRIDARL